MTEQPQLSDVTLTMIVRDELMNPAGGLHAVLSRHLPYFQNVVVLDTGSVDGTRQLLEQMAGENRQLKVYDAKFKGYGPARNTANSHVKTKYTLMLDADEVIASPYEFTAETRNKLELQPETLALRVVMEVVYPSGNNQRSWCWNPRLFQQKSARFIKKVWEDIVIDKTPQNGVAVGYAELRSQIYHFVPERKDWKTKNEGWYSLWTEEQGILPRPIYQGESPSQIRSFPIWKTPNLAALLQYDIDVYAEIEELDRMGLSLHPGIIERLSQTSP